MNLFDVLFARKLAHSGEYPPVIKRKTGNPITFTDGADAPLVECKAEIVATQDLHGYDKPWVGGAGKNKFGLKSWLDTLGVTYTQIGESFTITTNSLLYSTPYVFSSTDIQVTLSFKSFANGTTTYVRMTFLDSDNNVVASRFAGDSPQLSVIASKVRFDWTNTGDFVLDEAQIELGSTATTFEPYSNICPISGYDEVEIEVKTDNLIPVDGRDTSNGYVENAYLLMNGSTISFYNEFVSEYFEVVGGTSYLVTQTSDMNNAGLCFYDSNKNYISGEKYSYRRSFITVAPLNAKYCRCTSFYEWHETSVSINPTTYTISLGSTRYGGTVDVVRGKMVVAHGYLYLDGSNDEPWSSDDANHRFYIYDENLNAKPKGNDISDSYDYITLNSWTELQNGQFATHPSATTAISFKNTAIANLAAWKSYIATDPIEVCYELSTPIEVQLSPTQIRTLSGDNYISTNAKSLDITYITNGYQDFVDTVESALPNTRKGGTKPIDIFQKLEGDKEDEPKSEVEEEVKEEATKK